MKPIMTSACNTVFRAEGCEDLPALRGGGMTAVYFRPDAEELAAINAGLPIRVVLHTDTAFYPIAVDTETI